MDSVHLRGAAQPRRLFWWLGVLQMSGRLDSRVEMGGTCLQCPEHDLQGSSGLEKTFLLLSQAYRKVLLES